MKTTRRNLLTFALAAPALIATSRVVAAAPEVFAPGGIAVRGTDVVAYFREGRARPGSSGHALAWRGAAWHFASAENMAAFEMDPVAYAPQYGGYCAYAVAKGYTASTVPEAWTIHEGRLYLNYSRAVRLLWRRDIPGYIARADANWPQVLEG